MPKVSSPKLRVVEHNGTLSLRVTFNGKSKEKSLGLSSVGFDKKTQRFKKKALNDTLYEIVSKHQRLIDDGEVDFNVILAGINNKKKTIEDVVADYIEERELSLNTTHSYRTFKNHFKQCFDNIEDYDYKTFLKHLKDSGMSDASIRTILAKTRALGFEVEDSFRRKFQYAKKDYYLNEDQMNNVMKYTCTLIRNNEEVPDELVFFCLMLKTALSPIDLFNLKNSQIAFNKKDNKKYIVINGKRSKTGVKFKIVLDYFYVDCLFEYFFNKNKNGMYFLPFYEDCQNKPLSFHQNRLSNFIGRGTKVLRDRLSEVNKIIEKENEKKRYKVSQIDIAQTTFYTARHSVIMMLLNKNIPPAQLALFLGRSINTISVYFSMLETEQMLDIANI